ncbi:Exodeoxyribonuclease VII small subunit [Caldanaerobius fijiensis DSM 17918]|uniref:Exodeoxyribonuclease 7 small subunit n=1 Tax=Caldanaerobius fijiensis DSM 17918 TaxID=1121256 RepID=A0A1M4U7C8_9THEO|nr:exodeoxyribonuclease VII small subunit [Caldanaerobius fijiensis]SHE52771.1 Exodeoxyribonuclease VII small subunit [Caldanaerobius fijiensis DSM 17918]
MTKKSSDLTFEEALRKLEEIVKKLESGNQTLEDSLILFQEGIELSKICTKKLNDASGKISILTREIDGSFSEKPFVEDKNDR